MRLMAAKMQMRMFSVVDLPGSVSRHTWHEKLHKNFDCLKQNNVTSILSVFERVSMGLSN